MKVLKIKFETDGKLERFLGNADAGCPSEHGGKDSESCFEHNTYTCIKCWKDSGLICEEEEGNLENSSSDKAIKAELIQNRIKELKNSRAGYMVCGVSCNHAVVAELERLLQKIEDKEV